MEWRAFPTVGETLRWELWLLPPSGFTSTDELILGGGGEEQPSASFPVVEGSEVLPGGGLVGGSIPLRVIGGENATNFDVKSVVGRAKTLVSEGAAGGVCSGNTCLNGTGEEGGVLRLSASV